jgi:arylsulfatase A-like enzyme
VQTQPWVNQYDGALAYMDHELGIIFDTLQARGTLKNTLVIVTADHGESFGEHGLIDHRNSLYMPQLHVPLVMSLPGAIPGGVSVREPVGLRDLAATVLDVAGIHGAPIPGHSLVALWNGGAAEGQRSPRLAELEREADNRKPWAPIDRGDMETLFEGGLHYIRNGDGSEELYDIGRDPGELQNLATQPQMAPALNGLRSRLDSIVGPHRERKGG